MTEGRIGQLLVSGVAIFLVLQSLGIILLYAVTLGSGRLPVQLVRLLLSAVLAYYLWRGRSVARWITVPLLALAALLGAPAALAAFRSGSTLGGLSLAALAATYALAAGVLMSSAASEYFDLARLGLDPDA